ncbi:MAG TPA: DUF481 domain-containing protein [Chromatiales bacterium]|nr:DUF481 domain-containing protein [Chromatiaceae bacterium]HIB84825.1 DUF481 domain-containing protein [Chromatiaceae bacterium]HIO14462.1 DUF481 domain-containing protein [Chromatiales bacterium]HIO53686.1 DUF481 domain-containing protein [Chromatiales bacterium]
MRIRILAAVVVAMTAFAVGSAIADDDKSDSPWTMSAELGFVVTGGNTDTTSLNGKFNVTYEEVWWRHSGQLEVLSTSTDNVTSSEHYQAQAKSDYKLNEYDYVFGLVNLDKDRFSGFEYQHTVSGGYGRRVMDTDDMQLDLEIGAGVRFTEPEGGELDEEGLIRLAGKYAWEITDYSNFTQDLTVDIGEVLTVTKSVSSVRADINSTLAMKFSVTLKNNSEVPVGSKKTDTETTLNLVYTFQ